MDSGTQQKLKQSLIVAQHLCHSAAHEAGWWFHNKTGLDLRHVVRSPSAAVQELIASAVVAQKLCLVHSEITEAMEGHRKGLMDDKLPNRSMLEVELADAIIRILDLAGAMDLDVPGAVVEKMLYNEQRADHKPEARAAVGGKSY